LPGGNYGGLERFRSSPPSRLLASARGRLRTDRGGDPTGGIAGRPGTNHGSGPVRQRPRPGAKGRPKPALFERTGRHRRPPPERQLGGLRRHQRNNSDVVYLRLCFVEGVRRLGFEGGGSRLVRMEAFRPACGAAAARDDFIVGSQNRYGDEIGSGDTGSDPRSGAACRGGVGKHDTRRAIQESS
jgi:hypothetical protein